MKAKTIQKQTRLTRFSAENYKRISYAELQFDEGGNLIEITGEYANGKSSFMEGIEVCIQGKAKATGNSVRNGQQSAILETDVANFPLDGVIDDIRIKRILGKGEKLLVTGSDGNKVNIPPGKILESIRNKMVNPLPLFQIKRNAEFYEAMFPLVTLDVDIEQLDVDRKRIYDQRTAFNGNVTRLDGHIQQLKNAEILPDDLPEKQESSASINAEIATINDQKIVLNKNKTDRQADLVSIDSQEEKIAFQRDAITKNEETIADVKNKIIKAEKAISEAQSAIVRKQKSVSNIDQIIAKTVIPDIEPLNKKLANIDETNRLIRHRDTIKQKISERGGEQANVDKCNTDMRGIDSTKGDALLRAKFPVEGMSFDNGVVTLNGQPIIGGASESERFDACIEIAISKSYDLPFVIVPSGSGLGMPLLKRLAEKAKEHNCTVIIERLETSGEVGVYFEDGKITKDNRE